MKKIVGKVKVLITVLMVLAVTLSGCGAKDGNADEATSAAVMSEGSYSVTTAPAAKGSATSGSGASPTGIAVAADSALTDEGSSRADGTEAAAPMEAKAEVAAKESMAADMAGLADFSADTVKELADDMPMPDYYIDDPIEEPAVTDGDTEIASEEDSVLMPEEGEPALISAQAGLLTAGEWNDNRNFDFLVELLSANNGNNFAGYFNHWQLTPFTQVPVLVTDENGAPVENAAVELFNEQGISIYKARTNNEGMAYCFSDYDGVSKTAVYATASKDNVTAEGSIPQEKSTANDPDAGVTKIVLAGTQEHAKALDLMFVIDTTGSMGDEISYLKAELDDVIRVVKQQNGNIDVNLSVNFYRDHGDAYVVRSNEFSSDIEAQLALLDREYASGGGDYEEAVEEALKDAVFYHQWSEDTTKIMFLVLDAPPHSSQVINDALKWVVESASEQGIRIIPIASSGVDKSTEFLLRALAMTTGGTYTFLTDDSGVGGSHLVPTVGSYEVENLNAMLVRIIGEYLK